MKRGQVKRLQHPPKKSANKLSPKRSKGTKRAPEANQIPTTPATPKRADGGSAAPADPAVSALVVGPGAVSDNTLLDQQSLGSNQTLAHAINASKTTIRIDRVDVERFNAFLSSGVMNPEALATKGGVGMTVSNTGGMTAITGQNPDDVIKVWRQHQEPAEAIARTTPRSEWEQANRAELAARGSDQAKRQATPGTPARRKRVLNDDDEQLGAEMATYDEELQRIWRFARGKRSFDEPMARKQFSRFTIWEALDNSRVSMERRKEIFLDAFQRFGNLDGRFDFIGEVKGISGSRAYDIYKHRPGSMRRKRKHARKNH